MLRSSVAAYDLAIILDICKFDFVCLDFITVQFVYR